MSVVEVKLVVLPIIEMHLINSKYTLSFLKFQLILSHSHPGYFGKCGIRVFRMQKNRYFLPTINLDRLWNLVTEETRKKYATVKDKAPVIDVTKAGFFKVLGRGRLPHQPVVVKAKFFSKTAERRIKAAGGACVLVA